MSIAIGELASNGYTLKGEEALAVFDYNGPYTFMLWINTRYAIYSQSLFNANDNPTDSLGFTSGKATSREILYILAGVSGSTTARIRYVSSTNLSNKYFPFSSSFPIKTNTWQHVALVVTETTVRVFVDGEVVISSSRNSEGRTAPARRIDIGRDATGFCGGIAGQYAHIKLWTRALSDQEVLAEIPYASPVSKEWVFAWYPTRTGAGDQRGEDASGNGRDMQISAVGNGKMPLDGPNPDSVVTYPNPLPSPTADLTFNSVLRRRFDLLISGSLDFTGRIGKRVTKTVGGALSFSGTVVRAILLNLIAILTFSRNLNTRRKIAISIGGVLSFSGSINRSILKNLAGALSFVGSLGRKIKRLQALGGQLGFTGSIRRLSVLGLGGQLGFTGSVRKSMVKRVSGVLFLESFLNLGHRLIIDAELSFDGLVVKSLTRKIGGSLSFTGVVARFLSRMIKIAGALDFAGSISKFSTKVIAGVLSFSSGVGKRIKQNLAGVLSFSRSFNLLRSGQIAISATLTFSGSVNKRFSREVRGALSFAGKVSRSRLQIIDGSLSFHSDLKRLWAVALGGHLDFYGQVSRSLLVRIAGSIGFAGEVVSVRGKAAVERVVSLLGRLGVIHLRGEVDK